MFADGNVPQQQVGDIYSKTTEIIPSRLWHGSMTEDLHELVPLIDVLWLKSDPTL